MRPDMPVTEITVTDINGKQHTIRSQADGVEHTTEGGEFKAWPLNTGKPGAMVFPKGAWICAQITGVKP